MSRPRCVKCDRPGPVRLTLAGKLCKRCYGRLHPHLLRDPGQPRPNADASHRRTKQSGGALSQQERKGRSTEMLSPQARKKWRKAE